MTDSAREIVERVKAERGESLSLVIGNGCCDSTAPFLFAGYMAGPNELRIGSVADIGKPSGATIEITAVE